MKERRWNIEVLPGFGLSHYVGHYANQLRKGRQRTGFENKMMSLTCGVMKWEWQVVCCIHFCVAQEGTGLKL